MCFEYKYLVSFKCKIFYGNMIITSEGHKISEESHIDKIRSIIKSKVIEETKNFETGNIVITNIFLLKKEFKWK